MADWQEVCKVDTLTPGTFEVLETDDVAVAVFNLGGEYHAIADVCTHDGEVLTGGPIEGDEIICPRHGARFCIRTGEALTPPAYEPTRTFPVRIQGDSVQVDLEEA